MKPQTVTFQVSVITCTLRFHSHPRRQDIDPEGRSHAGRCRVNTGISAQRLQGSCGAVQGLGCSGGAHWKTDALVPSPRCCGT